jgi:hypothetical protein
VCYKEFVDEALKIPYLLRAVAKNKRNSYEMEPLIGLNEKWVVYGKIETSRIGS